MKLPLINLCQSAFDANNKRNQKRFLFETLISLSWLWLYGYLLYYLYYDI